MLKKIKNFFLELLAFTTKRAKVIDISVILIALRIIPPEKIGSYCIFKNFIFPFVFKTCPTKGLFVGCNCPACGLTRATSQALHGNFNEAWNLNKLIAIVLPFLLIILGINLFSLLKSKRLK